MPKRHPLFIAVSSALILNGLNVSSQQQRHTLTYAPGKTITLSLPAGFDIDIVAHGLPRVRFFAKAPDGRIFVTAMHSIADNRLGSIIILDGWDDKSRSFTHISHYLHHLHNPNSIAFWTDPKTAQSWLYVALTDKLVRYAYHSGDLAPTAAPQTLIRFPNYGLNYKYGGWHLTRTIAIGPAGGAERVFVSVGSSCNYCQEREVARASIISMDMDGANAKVIAHGIRNAVDLHFLPDMDRGRLFATNMGADHLGDQLPDDTFFEIDPSPAHTANYGWPACFFASGKATHDETALPSIDDPAIRSHLDAPSTAADDSVYGQQQSVAKAGTNLGAGGGHAITADPNRALGQPAAPLKTCETVPPAYAWFAAHSSPLGFAEFTAADPKLGAGFLVALHGAGHPHIGTGYRIVRIAADRKPRDFITGFLTSERGKPVVHGRPCGIFRVDTDSFLITDDYLGLIYFVHPTGPAK